jgi:hypothetical protein
MPPFPFHMLRGERTQPLRERRAPSARQLPTSIRPGLPASPTGKLYLIAGNLSSHTRAPIREWLATHSRIPHAFIHFPSVRLGST